MRGFDTFCHICLLTMALLMAIETVAQKPQFHLRPPSNWIGGPGSLFFDTINRTMHVYVQYNPNGLTQGHINWYHFASVNYVKWQDRGIALSNDKWYDQMGVLTGSITQNAEGTPVLMYTCSDIVGEQRQCVAIPPAEDVSGPNAPRELDAFVKLVSNPILTEKDVPGIVSIGNFHDPSNFWVNPDNESEWLVMFAVGQLGEGRQNSDHVLVFSTEDRTLKSKFKYSHSLWHEKDRPSPSIKSPELFKLDSEYFLKISLLDSEQDILIYGNYSEKNKKGQTIFQEDTTRTPTSIDFGRWYASKHSYDAIVNRTILWGFIEEEISRDSIHEQGWSGVMDMPRVVQYDENAKKIKTFPIPEFSKLRKEPLLHEEMFMIDSNRAVLSTKVGLHYELVVDFTLPKGAMKPWEYNEGKEPSFGVDVLQSYDFKHYTRIALMIPPRMSSGTVLTGQRYRTFDLNESVLCSQECRADRRCVAFITTQKKPRHCSLLSSFGGVVQGNNGTVTVRTREPVLLLDRTHSGTCGSLDEWVGRAPLHNKNKVQLRVFVDDTVVQAFKDGGLESITGRVYNSNSGLTTISLFASNLPGPVTAVVSLYPMDTVYSGTEGVESSEVGSSVGSSEVGSSVGSSEIDSSVGSSEIDSSVGSSEVGSSVGSSEVGSSVGSSEIDSSVGFSEIDSNAHSSRDDMDSSGLLSVSSSSASLSRGSSGEGVIVEDASRHPGNEIKLSFEFITFVLGYLIAFV